MSTQRPWRTFAKCRTTICGGKPSIAPSSMRARRLRCARTVARPTVSALFFPAVSRARGHAALPDECVESGHLTQERMCSSPQDRSKKCRRPGAPDTCFWCTTPWPNMRRHGPNSTRRYPVCVLLISLSPSGCVVCVYRLPPGGDSRLCPTLSATRASNAPFFRPMKAVKTNLLRMNLLSVPCALQSAKRGALAEDQLRCPLTHLTRRTPD